jgi:thiamine kinase-like enzyme
MAAAPPRQDVGQLHRQLHAIPAPADLPAPLGEGTSLVHLDLHPGNVLLTASGPVVIDWPNAGRGSGLADVACTRGDPSRGG